MEVMEAKEKLELAENIVLSVSQCPHCPTCSELAKLYLQNVKDLIKDDAAKCPPVETL